MPMDGAWPPMNVYMMFMVVIVKNISTYGRVERMDDTHFT